MGPDSDRRATPEARPAAEESSRWRRLLVVVLLALGMCAVVTAIILSTQERPGMIHGRIVAPVGIHGSPLWSVGPPRHTVER